MEEALLDDQKGFKSTFVGSIQTGAARDTESYYSFLPFISPKKLSATDWMHRLLPISQWMPDYRPRQSLLYDVVSGLVVGVLMVPQSMAYALLAGLPAEYGLYSCVVPAIVYALFGTCRQMSVGPVSIQCLLIAAAAGSLHLDSENDDDDDKYIRMALTMSLMIGIFQIFLGLFRLGVITNFLSKPVLSGFTSGAGFIIAVSQLKYFIGADVDTNGKETYTILYHIFANIPKTNLNAFFIGLTSFIFLLLMKRFNQELKKSGRVNANDGGGVGNGNNNLASIQNLVNTDAQTKNDNDDEFGNASSMAISSSSSSISLSSPTRMNLLKYYMTPSFIDYSPATRKRLLMLTNFGPMYVVIFASIIAYVLSHEFEFGLDLVGHVHKDFKAPAVPDFLSWSDIKHIMPFVLTAGFMSFVESFAIATKISSQLGYDVHPSQELLACGLANFVGSFFNSMPVAGSFTRSAVNFETGAQSLVSGIFAALFIFVSLFLLTPLFYYIPMSALGAIVLAVAIHLINIDDFSKTFKTSQTDSIAIFFTFLTTALLGVEIGILAGVFMSIAIVMLRFAFPKMSLLGQVPGHDAYRSVERYQDCTQFSGVRVDVVVDDDDRLLL